jgi:hypothetical protein
MAAGPCPAVPGPGQAGQALWPSIGPSHRLRWHLRRHRGTRWMAGVSLCPVRLRLDSLLGIDEHLRVVVDQGERDGAVGVESRVPQVGASWVGEVSRHLLKSGWLRRSYYPSPSPRRPLHAAAALMDPFRKLLEGVQEGLPPRRCTSSTSVAATTLGSWLHRPLGHHRANPTKEEAATIILTTHSCHCSIFLSSSSLGRGAAV